MRHTERPGEVRPPPTPALSGSASAGPPGSTLPLLSLRGERRVIPPDECRLRDCLVCAWRRAGLLDPDDASPRTEAA